MAGIDSGSEGLAHAAVLEVAVAVGAELNIEPRLPTDLALDTRR